MIGSLIGAGLGAAASIFGGIKARQAAKEAQRLQNEGLKKELDYRQAWYDRHYNEDATQRADAQRVLNMAMDRIKRRSQDAAGQAAVTGMSQEQLAAAKAADAEVYGNVAADIAASGAARKDAVDSKYTDAMSQINQQKTAGNVAYQQNAAQNVATATQGAASALANAGASIDALRDADKDRELWK